MTSPALKSFQKFVAQVLLAVVVLTFCAVAASIAYFTSMEFSNTVKIQKGTVGVRRA